MKKIVLTGDRPTGKLHLGHYIGSIQNRVKLQSEADKAYYMVADIQALTDNSDNPEKVFDNVTEVILDNLACGVDPKKTTYFIQSQIPEIAEMTVFFLNLVTVARLRRNPTVKDEMLQKGFADNVPAGFLCYPVSQAADILVLRANMIPVGEDQLPVLEQANEIVRKFNGIYGDYFTEIMPIMSDHGRLVGIDGAAKASKSLNNAIYLSDSPDDVRDKVMRMYTDPGHVRVADPGQVDGNVVFQYLDIFDQDVAAVSMLKEKYLAGGLGDVEIKKRLIDVLENVIAPIRTRRNELASDKDAIMEMIRLSTEQVQSEAREYMRELKTLMKINYFN